MAPLFADRADAGRQLARRLQGLALEAPVVLALPRGGVPLGAEVARALKAPLELMIVRKIGHPKQPELAIGAVADADPPLVVRNDAVIRASHVDEGSFQAALQPELVELERRRAVYCAGRDDIPLAGRTVVILDDGIATGATMRAAIRAARRRGARQIVVAAAVADPTVVTALGREADSVVVLHTPLDFGSVGAFFADFPQLRDDDVLACLAAAGSSALRP